MMNFNIDLKKIKNLKLPPAQRKFLIIAAVAVLAFGVFIKFGYMAQKTRYESLERELAAANEDIVKIKTAAGIEKGESMIKSLEILQKKLKSLDENFSKKEEFLLRGLPALAKQYGISIKSMQPQKRHPVSNIEGVEVAIEGCVIEEMQVSISAFGAYKSLGGYIRALKKEFPVPVRIDSLSMSGGGEAGQPTLNISMSITAYLVSRQAR